MEEEQTSQITKRINSMPVHQGKEGENRAEKWVMRAPKIKRHILRRPN